MAGFCVCGCKMGALQSSVSSPLHVQIALHFTPRQTCSFQHQFHFSGKAFSHTTITTLGTINHIIPPLATARYSPTQPSQLRQRVENEIAPVFETVAKRSQTQAPSIENSAFYRRAAALQLLYASINKQQSNVVNVIRGHGFKSII